MFPQVLSIIQVTFPPAERHAAFGILGMVLGAGSFMANVLGGFLVEGNLLGLGWRPIFLVNLPLGALVLLIAPRVLRESRSATALRLDLGGVPLISLALFLLVYPLAEGREAGWPTWSFVCLAASLPALVLFILYERWVSAEGGSPLVELGLFRDRVFVTGLGTTLAFYSGLSAFFLTVTFFLQEGLKLSPKMAGYTLVPFGIGFLIASSLAVKLARRLGSLTINVGAGMMIVALTGIVVAAHWQGAALSNWELIPLLLIYGTGQGLVMPTLISTVLSGIPHNAAGSASGVLTTTQQVAMSTGVAFISTIFFAILGGEPRPEEFAGAISTSLLANIVLLVATFLLAFLLPRSLSEELAREHVEL
jgi:MFS family permease